MIKLSWSLNEPCDIVFDNKKKTNFWENNQRKPADS